MYISVRLFFAIFQLVVVSANTYSVKIGAESHVNVIDSKFLSFTIDPKYLFSTSEKYKSKECVCMASALTPAYLRIAGPSTALMTYHNTSISIEPEQESRFQSFFSENLARIDEAFSRQRRREDKEGRVKRNQASLEVSHSEWRRFARWARQAGFGLVFALNAAERTGTGLWDPNMALNILTVADKADVGEIYWQLGYECSNQSIEEYLNDLETLRVITETFPPGRSGQWKVVGADVTGCLHQDSKSDFKDYVSLSTDMLDAILLNGNSSTAELERMSERDRTKLLRVLSRSSTPLWLTERGPAGSELARAADWLAGLGHAARNGFSVHYRELKEDEMFQPTLSFYMALLFKNLVGEKVLHVDMEPEQAIIFAHCTSLRHKEVPGAVTLYGVNMDDEPARFSVKLAKREEGGDVMQFVMGHDKNGNVVVNGRKMYHEGDIKPVVKRVRPYKTLLINLPAKSFGFWVLANTKIEACLVDEKYNDTENIDDAVTISEEKEIEDLKTKRSINVQDFDEYLNNEDISVDFSDANDISDEVTNENIRVRIDNINKDLNKVEAMFKLKSTQGLRTKRQAGNDISNHKIKKFNRPYRNRNVKSEPEQKPRRLFNLLKNTKYNITKLLKGDKLQIIRNRPLFNKNKLSKRQSDNKPKRILLKYDKPTILSKGQIKNMPTKQNTKTPLRKNIEKDNFKPRKTSVENSQKEITENLQKTEELKQTTNFKDATSETENIVEEITRTRRNTNDQVELSDENEVDVNGEDNVKLWKMLRKIHKQFKDLSAETEYVDDDVDDSKRVKAKGAMPRSSVDEKDPDLGDDTTFIKKTVYSLLRVISDLNKNLNRFWNGMRLID